MTAPHVYDLLAKLAEYPRPDLAASAADCAEALSARNAGASGLVRDFAAWAAATDPRDAEELYTRTFDLSPPCCPEVGWHLFADTYKRGAFLVKLRVAAREHDVDCGTDLPDHLSVVLRLLARLGDHEDPRGLATEVVLPALEKMLACFAPEEANPYGGFVRATFEVLAADFGLPAPEHTVGNGARHLPLYDPEVAP